MRTPLAWKNVTQNRWRAAASLTGVGLAILLIYMQIGFFDSCFRSSTMVYDQMTFEIAMVSPQYLDLRAASTFPRRRLYQARAVDGVECARPLYVGTGTWRNPDGPNATDPDKTLKEMLVLGVDPADAPFFDPQLARQLSLVKKDDTAIYDIKAQKGYGHVEAGTITDLDDRRIEVVGTYAHGTGFISDAGIIVSDRTMSRLFAGRPLEEVSVGLIKVSRGADVNLTAERLRAVLPPDVWVRTRPQLEAGEQKFFVSDKPIGMMFSSGVILAFTVGAVILYQVLAGDVMSRLSEFATLKAIGYSDGFTRNVVLKHAATFALLGFLPATVAAYVLYAIARLATNLPMFMTWRRTAGVLGLSLAMCCISGMLAIRKVSRADPVDLF